MFGWIWGTVLFAVMIYGLKEVYIAYKAYRITNRVHYKNIVLHRKTQKDIDTNHSNLQLNLKNLGTLKLQIYKETLLPFLESYHVMTQASKGEGIEGKLSKKRALEPLYHVRNKIQKMVDTEGNALCDAALMRVANYGGVLTCKETMSTKMHPALSWLNDENSSSMKLGILGSMGILGGIGNIFVWSIAGRFLSATSKKRKEQALVMHYQYKMQRHEMKTLQVKASAVEGRINELTVVIVRLNQVFLPILKRVASLIEVDKSWKSYSLRERKIMVKSYTLSKTIMQLLELNLVTSKGSLNEEGQKLIVQSNLLLEKENV